jgi:hypothetical protein
MASEESPQGQDHGKRVNDVLYHLTKEAIDMAMQREGEWCE